MRPVQIRLRQESQEEILVACGKAWFGPRVILTCWCTQPVSQKKDDLLKSLDKSGLEARIEDMDVGCVVYADDIVLLSPTVDGLQKMIDVSSSFANDHNLTFITVRNA